MTLKKIKLDTDYSRISEQIKPFQPVGQAAEFKFESKFEPLQVIWQSLSLLKAIPEKNQRFWMQTQWPSSWGSAPAQLGLRAQAQGVYKLAGVADGKACLRKTCYHSCYTDSFQESKRFWCFVNFELWQVTFFSMSNEIFYGIGEKLLPTKAQPIASLNLLIIHLSLIKNWA